MSNEIVVALLTVAASIVTGVLACLGVVLAAKLGYLSKKEEIESNEELSQAQLSASTENTRESRLAKREADHLDAIEADLLRVRGERDEWRGWCLKADKERDDARRKLEIAEHRYAQERQKATECALWSVTAYEKLVRWKEALLKTEPYVPENISEPPFMRRRREERETPLDDDSEPDEGT